MTSNNSERPVLLQDSDWDWADYMLNAYHEGIESGKFDSGESMSWWKYSDPTKFYQQVVVPKKLMLDHYRNAFNGTGIVRLNLSRGR